MNVGCASNWKITTTTLMELAKLAKRKYKYQYQLLSGRNSLILWLGSLESSFKNQQCQNI